MHDQQNHQQGFTLVSDSVLHALDELTDRVCRLEASYKAVYDLLSNISKIYDKLPAGEVKS
jgi:hypothetical protein